MPKLGAGLYRASSEALDAALAFPGPILLHENALVYCQYLKSLTPTRQLIGRLWVDNKQGDWLRSSDPGQRGREFAEQLLAHPATPYLDGWQSLNEITDSALWPALYEFEFSFAKTMEEAEKIAVIGNIAVGNMDAEELRLWATLFTFPNVWLGYHSYWPQGGPDNEAPWLAFRYRAWAEAFRERGLKFPLIFLNEYGVDLAHYHDTGPFEKFTGQGWRVALGGDEGLYLAQLVQYSTQVEADPLVVGATIFCCGDSGGWESFDVAGSNIPRDLARLLPTMPPEAPGEARNGLDEREEESSMNQAQLDEIQRIRAIFQSWVDALKARSEQAQALGYGITDSYSERMATELQGAVDSLKELPSLV